MVRLRWLAFVLALAASTAFAAAPAAAKSRPCQQPHSTTVAENGLARVFTRLDPDYADQARRLIGCFKTIGETEDLAYSADGFDIFDDFDAVTLRGRFVAWYDEHQDSCRYGCPPGYDGLSQTLRTYDLRSGENAVVDLVEPPAGRQLVLDAYGAIAWPVWLAHNQVEIRVRDAAGTRAVGSGSIHPEALRLSDDGLLTWDEEDQARSVQLRHPPPDTTAPRLRGLKVTKTAIEYELSEYAAVRFTIRRRTGGRSIALKGGFTGYGAKGLNGVTFSGRLRGRRLARGRYLLVARATDYSGHHSPRMRARFTIKRR